jgi:2-methylfumaryl-CoA hydratase
VSDISVNAVANLGYAEFRWGVPVFPGDTLSVSRPCSACARIPTRQSGVVWVRSVGTNQRAEMVLDYIRWVMVHKRDPAAEVGAPVVPKTAASVAPADLVVPDLSMMGYDDEAAGLAASLGRLRTRRAHRPCERHHARGLRSHVLDAPLPEHRARPFRRLCRQGHALRPAPRVWRARDFARAALSFNGLANGFRVAAVNGGSHVGPTFGGDTIYAWSEVLERAPLPNRSAIGALRVRTIATKDCPCATFPARERTANTILRSCSTSITGC